MARRKPTLNQLQWRFLRQGLQWLLPGIVFELMLQRYVVTVNSILALGAAPPSTLHPAVHVAPYVVMAIGVLVSAWRFYRDHYCGDIYLEIDW